MSEIDMNENEVGQAESIGEKEVKREARRSRLLQCVSACNLEILEQKVGWILNNHPEARNSDIALQLLYWETFENDIYDGHSICPENLYKLTRLTSIARARARIQNEYKLFVASTAVRQYRGTLSDEARERSMEIPPAYPAFMVYADESGKTQDNLVVGSIWFCNRSRGLTC